MTEPSDYSIAIIGANTAALHVLARLSTEQLKETAVIDTSGEWLAGFRDRHSNMQTQCLRSPVTWSPDPSPTSMQAYAVSRGRSKDIIRKVSNATPLPTPALFFDFCHQNIIKPRQQIMQRPVLKDTVLDISTTEVVEGRLQLQLASGRTLTAAAVVYAAASGVTERPEWWEKADTLCKGSDQLRDTVQLAAEVRLPDLDLTGKNVAVLGGGMAAAQLAVGALKRGAHHVTLISRRPLRRREQPCKPEWYGNKRLYDYRQLRSAEQRLMLCKEARNGASLNTLLWRQLQTHLKAGTLDIEQSKEVTAVQWESTSKHWKLQLSASSGDVPQSCSLSIDLVWCAMGCKRDFSSDPLLSKLQDVQPIRVVGDLPVLNHSRLQWPGLPMYIIGPLSLLSVGPGAADMPGLRWAADRVVAAINNPEESAQYAAPEPDEGVAEGKPGDVSTAHSCGKGGTAAHNSQNAKMEDECLTEEQLQLPRQLIDSYSWLDAQTSLRIMCTLPEAILKVTVHVQERSVSFLAASSTRVFVFEVPRLYGRVNPGRRTVQIKGCKLSVRLYKATEATWVLLKA